MRSNRPYVQLDPAVIEQARQMAKIKIAGQENSPGPLFFGSPKLQPLLNTKLFE